MCVCLSGCLSVCIPPSHSLSLSLSLSPFLYVSLLLAVLWCRQITGRLPRFPAAPLRTSTFYCMEELNGTHTYTET